MKTPTTSHISKQDFEHLYEPGEDTFLLLDTLEEQLPKILNLDPIFCLEIGSGSGLPITHLGQLIGPNCIYHTTDINPFACLKTTQTGFHNKVVIDSINTKFTQGIRIQYDVVLFNPPYVVTENIAKSNDIEAAWAGGIDGREVIDVFIRLVGKVVRKGGLLYLVCVNENKPQEIIDLMVDFEGSDVKYRVVGWEGLHVLEFTKIN
jgi:release factor glutamine methyltransferase